MAERPWPAAYAHCVYDCCRCHAPIPLGKHVMMTDDFYSGKGLPAHHRCAYAESAELEQIKAEACQQGHHLRRGDWRRDPADPYGDAMWWECARGCGFIKRHPGYGIGRTLAQAQSGVQPPLFELEAKHG